MNKYSAVRSDHIEYGFWLVFDKTGGVKLYRQIPNILRTERKMYLSATLPLSLFSEPELRARITVPEDPDRPDRTIDVSAAREALQGALGVDIDVHMQIVP